jgi:hypothetical protein
MEGRNMSKQAEWTEGLARSTAVRRGMEGRSVSKQADWTTEEAVQWDEVMVV